MHAPAFELLSATEYLHERVHDNAHVAQMAFTASAYPTETADKDAAPYGGPVGSL